MRNCCGSIYAHWLDCFTQPDRRPPGGSRRRRSTRPTKEKEEKEREDCPWVSSNTQHPNWCRVGILQNRFDPNLEFNRFTNPTASSTAHQLIRNPFVRGLSVVFGLMVHNDKRSVMYKMLRNPKGWWWWLLRFLSFSSSCTSCVYLFGCHKSI